MTAPHSPLRPAELLCGAIEEVADTLNINEAFLGLIVLPIAGNVTEHLTVRRAVLHFSMDVPWHAVLCCAARCRSCSCSPAGACRPGAGPQRSCARLSTRRPSVPRVQAVFVAVKNKMDLSIGIALGSSIQVRPGAGCCGKASRGWVLPPPSGRHGTPCSSTPS